MAFDSSALELGDDIIVDLPNPAAEGAAPDDAELPVRLGSPERAIDDASGPGVDRLRYEAELLAAREELRDARAAAHRAEEELSRAQADLDGERAERAADAARFREGLAKVRASAEEALAVEQSASRQLGNDLKAALEIVDAHEATLAEVREEARAELEAVRVEAEEARRRIAAVADAVEDARTCADGLVDRLSIRDEASTTGS